MMEQLWVSRTHCLSQQRECKFPYGGPRGFAYGSPFTETIIVDATQHEYNDRQLKSAGVSRAEHLAAAHAAVASGFSLTEVLGWITTYGPGVLAIVEQILAKKGGHPSA
jgi:hypothetical protein